MSKKRIFDLSLAVGLIIGSACLYLQARDFPLGADVFPEALLLTIIALAGLMVVSSLRRGLKEAAAPEGLGMAFRDKLRPYLLLLCILGYLGLILGVGFFPATVVFGLVLIWVLEVERRMFYLALFAGVLIFIYLLFVWFLKVPLPTGHLFG